MNAMIAAAVVISMLSAGIAAAAVFYTRRQLIRFTEEMEDIVDGCLQGRAPAEQFEEDTLGDKMRSRLLRLYSAMEQREQHASDAQAALQELVSDIAHQVRTPMANLRILHDTMMETADETQRKFLDASGGQLAKLDFLLEALVKTSRLETGLITLKKEVSPICDTIADALGAVCFAAEAKNLEIAIDCREDLTVPHDRKWTGEAVFNLLDNAVKYTPEGGHIHVSAAEQEMYLRITVSDNGPGIDEEHHSKIWKRFFREETVHSKSGAGIGLYLVRRIVTMQGGYVKVISEKGNGAAFSIYLLRR